MKPPPPANVNKEIGKPRPPKPVRTGSKRIDKTKMLEHYEFGRQYFEENPEAKEILKERYELPETGGSKDRPTPPTIGAGQLHKGGDYPAEEGEGSPYEIPVPRKPRSKTDLETRPQLPDKRVGFVTIHKGDTWVKPYATSPLYEEDSLAGGQDKVTGQPINRVKLKPVRPAPPAPSKIKPKTTPKARPQVSPYAVSTVQGIGSVANSK